MDFITEKTEEKMFNWSEVHLYRSNFLQNPYFNDSTNAEFPHKPYISQKQNKQIRVIKTL